jgi:hypothetical protein
MGEGPWLRGVRAKTKGKGGDDEVCASAAAGGREAAWTKIKGKSGDDEVCARPSHAASAFSCPSVTA